MEAAPAASSLPARLRAGKLEQELVRLRPLGEAYALRRFGGSLSRADAEDAVAEVIIRLHRTIDEGRAPDNLRAAFFTSVRNAGIDQLRSRAAKPTVALDAALETPAEGNTLPEFAEAREDAARLQEALGRMRGNYREAIMLRFGLGMTVPEMASHLGISLPAAKKLVLRATKQVRRRMQDVEDAEFCPEMRELARHSLVDEHASGFANEAEAAVLRSHFAHCGPCRSFLAGLREALHDLGATALLGLAADDRFGFGPGAFDHLARMGGTAWEGLGSAAGRLRHFAYKVGGSLPGSDGAAGALMGTGQKIAAVCAAGAATTATCLLTGAVGPGIGAQPDAPVSHHPKPAAQVRELPSAAQTSATETESPPPGPAAPEPESPPAQDTTSPPASSPAQAQPVPTPESAPDPPASEPGEFGIESAGVPAESSPAPSPPSAARTTEGSGAGEFGGGGASESSSAGGAGVGFHG
jgi:RNA polymerase sigma factor (sigma-70 family)